MLGHNKVNKQELIPSSLRELMQNNSEKNLIYVITAIITAGIFTLCKEVIFNNLNIDGVIILSMIIIESCLFYIFITAYLNWKRMAEENIALYLSETSKFNVYKRIYNLNERGGVISNWVATITNISEHKPLTEIELPDRKIDTDNSDTEVIYTSVKYGRFFAYKDGSIKGAKLLKTHNANSDDSLTIEEKCTLHSKKPIVIQQTLDLNEMPIKPSSSFHFSIKTDDGITMKHHEIVETIALRNFKFRDKCIFVIKAPKNYDIQIISNRNQLDKNKLNGVKDDNLQWINNIITELEVMENERTDIMVTNITRGIEGTPDKEEIQRMKCSRPKVKGKKILYKLGLGRRIIWKITNPVLGRKYSIKFVTIRGGESYRRN